MQPDAPLSTNHEPEKGLPAVVPPSGKHIVQLFVVPLIMVAVALMVIVGFTWLVGGMQTSQEFHQRLESPNPDVRWRAANDLAQMLKRDDQMASDPVFGLKMADKYQQALNDFEQDQRALLQQQSKLSAGEYRGQQEKLKAKRNYAVYLGACLGNLTLPVGAPLLAGVARAGSAGDKETNALFRRQAVWALANLGNNLRRFQQLPFEKRDAILAELQRQADASTGERKQWALQAGDFARSRRPLGVIDSLTECARSDDIFLRGLVALALNFWDEGPEKERVLEDTLVRLSDDRGQGEWIYIDVPELPALPGGR